VSDKRAAYDRNRRAAKIASGEVVPKYRRRASFDGTCSKCGCELTDDNWAEARRTRDDYRCKSCCTVYSHTYRTKNPSKYLWSAAKTRAKDKGLEFCIVPSDIVIPDTCPVLGIPLTQSVGGREDGSASLDRIKSEEGYVKGNIEVISWRANNLKSDATPTELRLLANYYEGKACG
jgi:hypothetical protein